MSKVRTNIHTERIEYNGQEYWVIPLSRWEISTKRQIELSHRISCCCKVTMANSNVIAAQYQNFSSLSPGLWKDTHISYWFDNEDMCFELDKHNNSTAIITAGDYNYEITKTMPFDNFNNRHQEIMNDWKKAQPSIDVDNNMILFNKEEIEQAARAIAKNGYCDCHAAMRKQAQIYNANLKNDIDKIYESDRYKLFKDAWNIYIRYAALRYESRWRMYNNTYTIDKLAAQLNMSKNVRIALLLAKDLFDDAYKHGRRDKPIRNKELLWPIINDLFDGVLYEEIKKKYMKKRR